jgi:hypothetical protein
MSVREVRAGCCILVGIRSAEKALQGPLKATAPTTVEGTEKYLGSGIIRGIGSVYANKLVRAFGETVFDVHVPQLRERLLRSAC